MQLTYLYCTLHYLYLCTIVHTYCFPFVYIAASIYIYINTFYHLGFYVSFYLKKTRPVWVSGQLSCAPRVYIYIYIYKHTRDYTMYCFLVYLCKHTNCFLFVLRGCICCVDNLRNYIFMCS